MLDGLRTVVFHVADLEKAKTWYKTVLEKEPYFDEPFYVGFNVGGYELGLHPGGTDTAKPAGSVTYWGVPDADAALVQLVEMGATSHESVTDVGDGIRLGAVLDPFGNVLGVIYNPHFGVPDAHNAERSGAA